MLGRVRHEVGPRSTSCIHHSKRIKSRVEPDDIFVTSGNDERARWGIAKEPLSIGHILHRVVEMGKTLPKPMWDRGTGLLRSVAVEGRVPRRCHDTRVAEPILAAVWKSPSWHYDSGFDSWLASAIRAGDDRTLDHNEQQEQRADDNLRPRLLGAHERDDGFDGAVDEHTDQ